VRQTNAIRYSCECGSEEMLFRDTGRYKISLSKSDEYVFKSPSPRNIDLTPPYFHSGKVWGLKETVRIMGTAQLGATLTDAEVDRIAEFPEDDHRDPAESRISDPPGADRADAETELGRRGMGNQDDQRRELIHQYI
jgi:cytochrome c peroxidase